MSYDAGVDASKETVEVGIFTTIRAAHPMLGLSEPVFVDSR